MMLTEGEMDVLMEMLGGASLEQLDTAWVRIVVERTRRRPCIIIGLPLTNAVDGSSCDVASGAVKTLYFQGERSD